jgi:hypothetical protein
VSKSKKVFFAGASIILVLVVLSGCLPNKQGGFSCIATPLVAKLQSMLPKFVKPGTSPDPAQQPLPKGSPVAAVPAQPADFKAEESKINAVVSQIAGALKAKDVEGVLKYFAEEERETYRKAFSQSPDVMPSMAADLAKARIASLSYESNEHSRTAEYTIPAGSGNLNIEFVNVDGQWLLKTF